MNSDKGTKAGIVLISEELNPSIVILNVFGPSDEMTWVGQRVKEELAAANFFYGKAITTTPSRVRLRLMTSASMLKVFRKLPL